MKKALLVCYNATMALGWGLVMAKVAQALAAHHGDASHVWQEAGDAAKLVQAASVLDVLLALIGWVPSSPVMALVQWAGKSNALFLVVAAVPEVQGHVAVTVMLVCWSISEMIRYPWYALQLLGGSPYALTWLRYTAFYPLYPAGMLSEVLLLYTALPQLDERKLYSFSLPNAYNWAFDYATFVRVGLVLYVPIWLPLYTSLMAQRRKKLGGGGGGGAAGLGGREASSSKKDE